MPPNPWQSWQIDGEAIHHCPASLVTPEAREIVELFVEFKETGRYPFQGARFEQPNKLLEAFEIVGIAMAEQIKSLKRDHAKS